MSQNLRNRQTKESVPVPQHESDSHSGGAESDEHIDGDALRRAAAEAARRRQFLGQQQASLEVSGSQAAARKVLEEKHEVLMKAIFSTVMDFRVTAPQKVGACIVLLHKMTANIVASPKESKFRQVRASSKSFAGAVSTVVGAEAVLRDAGWRVRTEAFEKYWYFDHMPGSVEWLVLEGAVKELAKAEAQVNEKLKRLAAEDDAVAKRKSRDDVERKKIMLQIRGDKLERQDRSLPPSGGQE